jgi:hypothetical protein
MCNTHYTAAFNARTANLSCSVLPACLTFLVSVSFPLQLTSEQLCVYLASLTAAAKPTPRTQQEEFNRQRNKSMQQQSWHDNELSQLLEAFVPRVVRKQQLLAAFHALQLPATGSISLDTCTKVRPQAATGLLHLHM